MASLAWYGLTFLEFFFLGGGILGGEKPQPFSNPTPTCPNISRPRVSQGCKPEPAKARSRTLLCLFPQLIEALAHLGKPLRVRGIGRQVVLLVGVRAQIEKLLPLEIRPVKVFPILAHQ